MRWQCPKTNAQVILLISPSSLPWGFCHFAFQPQYIQVFPRLHEQNVLSNFQSFASLVYEKCYLNAILIYVIFLTYEVKYIFVFKAIISFMQLFLNFYLFFEEILEVPTFKNFFTYLRHYSLYGIYVVNIFFEFVIQFLIWFMFLLFSLGLPCHAKVF